MTALDTVPASACTSNGSRLVIHTDPTAFDELRNDWQALEARDSRCSVFQTHTWISQIKAFESETKTRLQLAVVHGPDGRLDAIAPFVIENRLKPVGVRVLRFIGRNFNDYQDILLADDCDKRAAISLLSDWLHGGMDHLDMIEWLKLQADSHLWEHRDSLLPPERDGCRTRAETYDQSRCFPIENDFDAYQMTLSKPTRKNLRRYWKRLVNEHGAVFQTTTSSRDVDALLDNLVELHQKRQAARGQRGMFRTAARIRIFTRLFKSMLDEGTLRLHVLGVNGRVYNIDLVFYHKQTVLMYNGGMDHDPAVAQLSPGFVAIVKTIEAAYAEGGYQKFDLGQGNEDYKRHLARHTQPLQRVYCERHGLRSRLDHTYHRLLAEAHQSEVVQKLYFRLRRKGPPPAS